MTLPAALTPGALDEIEALEKAATPGEWGLCAHWKADACSCGNHRGYIWAPDGERVVAQMGCEYHESGTQDEMRADARLIAALRNAAPALIASARELERMRERIATIADEATGPHPVQSVDESLSCIERAMFESRRSYEEMYQQRKEHRLAARAALADLAKARGT